MTQVQIQWDFWIPFNRREKKTAWNPGKTTENHRHSCTVFTGCSCVSRCWCCNTWEDRWNQSVNHLSRGNVVLVTESCLISVWIVTIKLVFWKRLTWSLSVWGYCRNMADWRRTRSLCRYKSFSLKYQKRQLFNIAINILFLFCVQILLNPTHCTCWSTYKKLILHFHKEMKCLIW